MISYWTILAQKGYLKSKTEKMSPTFEFYLLELVYNYSQNILDKLSLREKCPNTEFFLVCIFPHSDWIRRDTYLSVFSPNAGKYGLEITPYLDTFHAVSRLHVNDALREKFNFDFSVFLFFSSIDQILILRRALGIMLEFYEVLKFSVYFLVF